MVTQGDYKAFSQELCTRWARDQLAGACIAVTDEASAREYFDKLLAEVRGRDWKAEAVMVLRATFEDGPPTGDLIVVGLVGRSEISRALENCLLESSREWKNKVALGYSFAVAWFGIKPPYELRKLSNIDCTWS